MFDIYFFWSSAILFARVIFGHSYFYLSVSILLQISWIVFSFGLDIYLCVNTKNPFAQSRNIKRDIIGMIFMPAGVMVLMIPFFGFTFNLLFTYSAFALLYWIHYVHLPYHFILNYCLWREKSMAFPMARFYKYCVDLRILETCDGSWRFRHQILQDYFYDNKRQ